MLERQGLPEEAVEAYRNAVKLDPKSASAHYNLGSALVQVLEKPGRTEAARREMAKALD